MRRLTFKDSRWIFGQKTVSSCSYPGIDLFLDKVPLLPFTVLLSEFAPLCLADNRSFPFLGVMLKAVFGSNSDVKLNKELQNKTTDLFMKLADISFDPTALKILFDKYRSVLIRESFTVVDIVLNV